jgi:hypothetical protein
MRLKIVKVVGARPHYIKTSLSSNCLAEKDGVGNVGEVAGKVTINRKLKE